MMHDLMNDDIQKNNVVRNVQDENVQPKIYRSRVLKHHDLVERILRLVDHTKFNIVTFKNVFLAFQESLNESELKSQIKFQDYKKEFVSFDFEVDEFSEYLFIIWFLENDGCIPNFSFKLPNDGFFYTSEYKTKFNDLPLFEELGKEVQQDVDDFIDIFILFIYGLKLDDFEDFHLDHTQYDDDESRLQLCFYDKTQTKCISFSFEYGWPKKDNRQRKLPSREVKRRLENMLKMYEQ